MLSLSLFLSHFLSPPLLLLLPLLYLPTPLLANPNPTTTPTPPSPPLRTLTLHHHPVPPSTHPSTHSQPQPLAILTYAPNHPHLSTLVSFTPPANTTDLSALTSVVVVHEPDAHSGRFVGAGVGWGAGGAGGAGAGGGAGGGGGGKSGKEAGKGGKEAGGEEGSSSSSTLTATHSFHAPCRGRFRIVLGWDGEVVVGASWHSRMAPSTTTAVVGKEVKEVKGGEKNENGRGDFDILTTKAAPGVVFEKGMKGKGKGKGIGGGVGAAGAEGGEEEVVEKTLLQKYWWVLLGVAVLAMAGGGDK